MSVKKLDHISIMAKKPQEVMEFYKNFLNFELISKREVPSMGMNIYLLKGVEEIIEIIEPTKKTKMEDGLKHIAFFSDNIEEDFNFFKEKGAALINKEVQHLENLYFFFVKSPSGELVEIIQY
jgi:catechol 2,3-dioxygenase-like lactoylglutathione lyase family enzyme